MKYIRIMNPAENVDRIYLEKLGISTKRNDADTIGQFGSGAKLAPIAALRNGWEWIFTGQDENGPYKLEYIAIEEGKFENIYYKYNDGEELKPSSFTIDAGCLSWDEDFQIFREAFANAMDEYTLRGVQYSIDYVDNVQIIPGHFCVYLTASPRLRAIADNLDMWFSFNRKPLTTIGSYKVYDKPVRKDISFFTKGVFAGILDKPGLFDYEDKDLPLNEERRIKNAWTMQSIVSNALVKLPNDSGGRAIISKILDNLNSSSFETNMSGQVFDTPSIMWASVWKEKFGDKAVPVNASNILLGSIEEKLKFNGYTPVRVESTWLINLFERAGILTPTKALGEVGTFNILDDIGPVHSSILLRAMDVVSTYMPAIKEVPVKIFRPEPHQANKVYGLYIHGEKTILLSEQTFTMGIGQVIATLVHECDHHTSQFLDDDPRFRNLADNHIANLLQELVHMRKF